MEPNAQPRNATDGTLSLRERAEASVSGVSRDTLPLTRRFAPTSPGVRTFAIVSLYGER